MYCAQVFGALIAALSTVTLVFADLCALGSQEIAGNWYCQAVTQIQYSNVGTAGSYKSIVGMSVDGICSAVSKPFSGPISPLDEEVSVHIRGPAHIHQFAVYLPRQAEIATRNVVRDPHQHRHSREGVGHGHGLAHQHPKRDDVTMITATIDGKVVTWANNYVSPSSIPASMVWVTATVDGQAESWLNNWLPEDPVTKQEPTSTSSSVLDECTAVSIQPAQPAQPAAVPIPGAVSSSPVPTPTNVLPEPPIGPGFDGVSIFERVSFYHADSQNADNVAFLGNYGGQGSGCFDYKYGASLSYANSAGTGGAASAQILANAVIPSGSEVVLMHGDDCSDHNCGYVRPGAVAHHGWDGSDKVFLFEFTMPMDGEDGRFEGDMPAIWFLNAAIPRTTQYGPSDCNCWTSGCGEFDVVEALHDGSTMLKSTLHTNTPAGDSDYFSRPTGAPMKLAVIFSSSSSTITIQKLDDDFEFPNNMTGHDIEQMCSQSIGVSHFSVAT